MIERFASFEEFRVAVRQFARAYNAHWLLERDGYRTPAEARELLLTAVGGGGMISSSSKPGVR